MKIVRRQIRLAGTDLSNHLACRHVTKLDLELARGERAAPDWAAPDLKVIQELGRRHEMAYVAHLSAQGLLVENLEQIDHKEEERLLAETLALMERGAEVIAQGALSDEDSAAVAVFGFVGENARDGAGVLVGGAAGRRVCGGEISCIGVCRVLPACAEAPAEGRGRGRR